VNKLIGVILALIPLFATMTAILVFKMKTHWAGLLGTIFTWIIAIAYCGTDLYLLPLAWIFGILVPLSYFLVSIAAWFMTFHMMYHGCFEDIQEALKRMRGGTVFKTFFLCSGLGTMMLSSGAGFEWLSVVLKDMGISPWALSILIEGFVDPLNQYAYYATPVTVPTLLFGEELGFTLSDLMPMFNRFFWITVPGFSLGMLWVLKQDGHEVTRKTALGAIIYGLSLAAIVNFLNLTVDIMAVGILAGSAGIGLLFLAQKIGLVGSHSSSEARESPPMSSEQKRRLYLAVAPIIIVSVLASVWGSFGTPIETAIGTFMIPIVADQSVPFKIVQPCVWPAITVFIMFTFLRPSRESLSYVGKLFKERWAMRWVATWMFAGMVFTYNWSGKVIIDGKLVIPPGGEAYNLLSILARAAVGAGLHPYMCMVPFISLFATTLLGTELTSTTFFTPFHFIAAKILGFSQPTVFLAGHIVANISITDIRKLMKNVALIGAYGEEYKALRRTFIIGLIVTAATIIPLMSFLVWPYLTSGT
jgi:hypothetical protein